PRRGQERDLARRVTDGRRALRPRVPRRESQKECAGNQRQRCRCSPDELACRKHWQSLAPDRARRHQLAENHGKSRSAMRISAALLLWNWKLAQTRARRLRVPSAAALARRLRLFALGRTRMSSSCNILNGRVFAHTDMTARDEGAVRSHCTICPDLDIGRSQEGAAKFDFGPGAARPFE